MAETALPIDTGDARKVTQRNLREATHMIGRETAAELAKRDKKIDRLTASVKLLTKALENVAAEARNGSR